MYETREWQGNEVIKMGEAAFKYFNKAYDSKVSCKPYMFKGNGDYDDCMVEKVNCAYEETIAAYKGGKQDEKNNDRPSAYNTIEHRL